MKSQEISPVATAKSSGDAAVDGLLVGVVAGLVMILFLLLASLLGGESATDVLGRFDPLAASSPVTGSLTHLAVSAVYGLLFALLFLAVARIRPSTRRFGWLAGLIYGLLLYGVARGAILAGANSGLVQFTASSLLLAHVVYGLVIGILIARKWR